MTEAQAGLAPGQTPSRHGARPAEGPSDGELLRQFCERRDEAAFAALVRRHGPLVLGVCRRVLRDVHAAEDAFQATFLVLARKAAGVGRPERLANWLYGVAYRTALKARARAARRGQHERQAGAMAVTDPEDARAWRELCAALDEEVSRLPERYRAPLVLCYLQGKTNEDAARQLGWPAGSMSYRLARGRELLRERLANRGLTLAAVPFAALLSREVLTTPVSAALAHATVDAALLFAAGKLAAGGAVSAAAGLAEQVLAALAGPRGRWQALVLLAGGLTLLGAAAFAYSAGGPWPAPLPAAGLPAPTAASSGCHAPEPAAP
jgi:RNA polymerase sigma factor (sigma-70 family)